MSKKKGSLSSGLISGIWILIIIGAVLAALQATGINSPEALVDFVKEKSTYYMECIPNNTCGAGKIAKDVINGVGSGGTVNSGDSGAGDSIGKTYGDTLDRNTVGYRGPAEGEPYVTEAGLVTREAAQKTLNSLEISDSKNKDADEGREFKKENWNHWISRNNSCWNVREHVLNRDAVPGTIKLLNEKAEPTDNLKEACGIGVSIEKDGKINISGEAGTWIDPYSGGEFTDLNDLVVSHIVSLENANSHGGAEWSPEKKEAFANDLDNLIVVSKKEHRAKADKGPGKYMPIQKTGYRCSYAKSYVSIANKYGLSITESDYKVLTKAITSCPN